MLRALKDRDSTDEPAAALLTQRRAANKLTQQSALRVVRSEPNTHPC